MVQVSAPLTAFLLLVSVAATAQVTPEYIYERVIDECRPPNLLGYAQGRTFFNAYLDNALAKLPPRKVSNGESADREAKEKLTLQMRNLVSSLADHVESAAQNGQKRLKTETIEFIRIHGLSTDTTLSLAISTSPLNCKAWLNGIGYLDIFGRLNEEVGREAFRIVDSLEVQGNEIFKQNGWD